MVNPVQVLVVNPVNPLPSEVKSVNPSSKVGQSGQSVVSVRGSKNSVNPVNPLPSEVKTAKSVEIDNSGPEGLC